MSSNNSLEPDGFISEIASGIKKRIRWLMFAGMSTVFTAFALSFYYALISGESSVMRQFPELVPVIERFRTILLVNTIGFTAVLVASFYFLSVMLTNRMFKPLRNIHEGSEALCGNSYPDLQDSIAQGPFMKLESSFWRLMTSLRQRDEAELELLRTCIASLPESRETEAAVLILEKISRDKNARLGENTHGEKPGTKPPSGEESLFMQPV